MTNILPAITIMAALLGLLFIVRSVKSYRKKIELEDHPYMETYQHGFSSWTIFWGPIFRQLAQKEKTKSFWMLLLGLLLIGLAIFTYLIM